MGGETVINNDSGECAGSQGGDISVPVLAMKTESSDSVEIIGNDVVLQSFISAYERLPELWNPTHSNYMNKSKRNAALDQLVSIYVKSKPGATRADVRRKINTLRCNYRKELKKIEDSKRSATSVDDVYSPTSWVFYWLQFIYKFEQPVNAADLATTQSSNDPDNDCEDNESPSVLQTIPCAGVRSSITISPARSWEPTPKKTKQNGPIALQNELLQKACWYLENSSKIRDEPKIPTVAKAWGEKLLQLHPKQREFAEKAINDILFEASQGTLSRHSVKINDEGFSTVTSPVDFSNDSVRNRFNHTIALNQERNISRSRFCKLLRICGSVRCTSTYKKKATTTAKHGRTPYTYDKDF